MRNIVAHGYFKTDVKILWRTVKISIPRITAAHHIDPGQSPLADASGQGVTRLPALVPLHEQRNRAAALRRVVAAVALPQPICHPPRAGSGSPFPPPAPQVRPAVALAA